MKFTKPKQGLLVISNDSFLVGLLTGYSAANNLSFHAVSNMEALTVSEVVPTCRVIIFDQRTLSTSVLTNCFHTLHQINSQYSVSICAIYNHKNAHNCLNFSWVNYFNDTDLVAQLDRHMVELIAPSSSVVDERRNIDRRAFIDRREKPASVHSPIDETSKNSRHHHIDHNERFNLGPFLVDKNSYAVFYKTQNLSLTIKEFKLFMLLAEAHDHVCSTETIISNLWPDTKRANKSDLYQYMHLLRKKVEEDPEDPQWIHTVKGVGYSLNTNEIHET